MRKIIALLVFSALVFIEVKTSYFQSFIFHYISSRAGYKIEKGGNNSIIFPKHGPFDNRLGYNSITKIIKSTGWDIESQAKWSKWLKIITKKGLFPPYEEKQNSGLIIKDYKNSIIFNTQKPKRLYKNFNKIPSLFVETLLFVESKGQLNKNKYHNPVIEWDRLILNISKLLARKLKLVKTVNGASTLATQTEKYKHSINGKTRSANDKIKQIVSASLKVYRKDRIAIISSKNIITTFINSVPLGSNDNYGEIIGFGDAIYHWFGIEFNNLNLGLYNKDPKYFKPILSLIVSERRPNFYLNKGRKELNNLTNKYANILFKNNIISYDLLNKIVKEPLLINKKIVHMNNVSKGIICIKRSLLNLLKQKSIYDLDTLDLEAKSTINSSAQLQVVNIIKELQDNNNIKKFKLIGDKLLTGKNDTSKIQYSFSLYEKINNENHLRIQVDTSPGELNLNDGMKLELGSTAKLRTLVLYLQVIKEIYENKHFGTDNLSQWVKEQKVNSLKELLYLAMEKKYSGSPYESFYTGGGRHSFVNFEGKLNGKNTVRVGLQRSINLIFIRIMRDIRDYFILNDMDYFLAKEGKVRNEYINKFIMLEGNVFLNKFISRHKNKTIEESFENLLQRVPKYSFRIATLFRTIYPNKSFNEFKSVVGYKNADKLFKKYEFGNFNWQDIGYITRLHPLEVWLIHYKAIGGKNIKRDVTSIIRDSYKWIWKPNKTNAQNRGIYQLLEINAFNKILSYWKKVGYPFNHIVPSLATSIGSSSDRPTSLSRLIGMIINDGKLCPERRFTSIKLGKDTPYYTHLVPSKGKCTQVINKDIADIVFEAINQVVKRGTAIRIRGSFNQIGGKTGTGDNRVKKTNHILNRTGTFVFHINKKFFGVITVFVEGKDAGKYKFTSSFPLRILQILAPIINKEIVNR